MLNLVFFYKWGYLCSSAYPGYNVQSLVKSFDVLIDLYLCLFEDVDRSVNFILVVK